MKSYINIFSALEKFENAAAVTIATTTVTTVTAVTAAAATAVATLCLLRLDELPLDATESRD